MQIEKCAWLLLLLLNSIMFASELLLFIVIQYSTQYLNPRQKRPSKNGRLKKRL